MKQGTRGGAHVEHVLHVYDAGGVEAQRLVERIRDLPRVERRAYVGSEVQSTGRREVVGDRGARDVQGRARDCRLGAGHGEERTENMLRMLVTLEVLKLSGWLNAYACCRESKQGRTVRGELRTWRREMAGDVPSSVQGRGRLQIRGRARGGSARRTCGTWL